MRWALAEVSLMDITVFEYSAAGGCDIPIYFLSDIHWGQAGVDKRALNEAVGMIAADDGAVVVLLGDLVDAIVPLGDKRFNPLEIDPNYTVADLEELPKAQADDLLLILDKIKDKIMVSVSGNHETAFTKYHGFNPAKYIANRLGVPLINYLGYHSIKVNIGGHIEYIQLLLNHGDGGGGKSAGAAKNKIDDLARFFDADIAAFAHIHKLEILHNTIIGLDSTRSNLKRRQQLAICTGCFLRTYTDSENYFAHKGRRESDVGMVKVTVTIKSSSGWYRKIKAEEIRF
jgi:hypothetical protein